MRKKTTILIVEDEKLLLDILSKKLGSEGFKAIKASRGDEGWKKIKADKPDMVLLDMMLPGMNGIEILEKMKEAGMDIPVIIISNSGQPVDVQKAFQLGVCDFLIKLKFEPEEVVEKVKHCFLLQKNQSCRIKAAKIMVVEDDRFLRDLCVKQLMSEGYCVDISIEGDEAYDKIRCKKPDLVLLDIVMPGMSGFDILAKIRGDKDKEIARIPIVMLSNLGQDNDIAKAQELGADDFLIKANFDLNTLGKKIEKYLK